MRSMRIPRWAGGLTIGALALVFVLTPDGWNVIPLILMALAAAAMIQDRRPARAGSSAPATPAGEEWPEAGSHPTSGTTGSAPKPSQARRLNRAFGPVAAGLVIDLLDLSTFGPIGLYLGFPVGGLAGYWMGRALGLDRRMAGICAVAAGVYCVLPGTEFIPLATLVGALARFHDGGSGRRSR